jgi:hypothetical protein
MPSRKDPPVRPPPITNVNHSNSKLLTEEAVTLRNPANISKLFYNLFLERINILIILQQNWLHHLSQHLFNRRQYKATTALPKIENAMENRDSQKLTSERHQISSM